MNTTLLSFSFSIALAVTTMSPSASAQGFTSIGVGGRIEQQIAAIQRNVPLPTNGSVLIPSASTNRRIFVRFIADSNRTVTGFDLNMRVTLIPEIVNAWLYTADAQNRPATAVCSGEIGLDTSMRYCRASFRDSYNVVSGQLYFVAFTLPSFQDLRFANVTASGVLPTTYFVTATGPAQTAGIQLKVNAGGYSPQIDGTKPYFNSTFDVRCTQASYNQPGYLFYQLVTPGLPLDLNSYGAPGAFLYLGLNTMLLADFAPADPDRSRQITFYMPYLPQFQGAAMWFQWLLPTSSGGFTMSDLGLTIIN